MNVGASGRFELDSNETIGALVNSGTVALGTRQLTLGGGSTLGTIDADSGGTLVLAAGNSTGDGNFDSDLAVQVDAGTLQLGADESIAGLTLNGTGTVSGSGRTLNVGGAATLDSSGTSNANFNFAGTGEVAVSDGTYNGDVTFGSSGTQSVTGGTFGGHVAVNRDTTVTGGTFTGTAGIAASRTLTVAPTSGNVAFSGAISGDGALTKTAAGTVTLSGTNTYTGATAVNGGTLVASGGAAIRDDGAVNVGASGRFELDNDETVGTLANSGTVALGANRLILSGGSNLGTINADSGAKLVLGGGTSTTNGNLDSDLAVQVDAGTLQLGADESISGLTLNNASAVTGSGRTLNVSGAAALDSSGTSSAKLNFTGSGDVAVSDGTYNGDVTFGSSGAQSVTGGTFAGTVNIGDSRTLTVGGAGNTTFSGDIGNSSGALVKNDAGTLTLEGAIGHTGGTTLNAGVLAVEKDFSSTLTFNGGELQVNGGTTSWDAAGLSAGKTVTVDSGTWETDALSLTGGAVKLQNGATLTVTGDADFSGGTFTFANSTLNVGGTLAGVTTVASGQTVNLTATSGLWGPASPGDNLVVDGTLGVSSAGTLNATGGLTANGNVTVAGTATVNGLAVGGGGTMELDGGTLILTGDVDFSNLGGGTFTHTAGEIRVSGGTTTWVAGDLTAGQALTLAGGTLEIADQDFDTAQGTFTATGGRFAVANGRTLSGNAAKLNDRDVANGGTVEFDQTGADGEYSGVISGGGSLLKNGTRTLTLSGLNTYTGSTTVSAGRLVVNGQIVGELTVENGAILGGGGSVRNVRVNGTIAPGNSIGTMTITGDYTHDASATYDVEIDAGGGTDLIDVSGTATIGGGTVNVQPESGTYEVGDIYTILEADGGVFGEFDTLTIDLIGLKAKLLYTDYDIRLKLLSLVPPYTSIAGTPNEMAVARVLEPAAESAAGDFAVVLEQLDTVVETPAGPGCFDQLAGEVFGSTASVGLQSTTLFLDSIGRRLRTMDAFAAVGGSGPVRRAPSTIRGQLPSGWLGLRAKTATWRPWYQGYGVSGNAGGNGNASGLNYSIGGATVAIDRALGRHMRFGIVGGYGSSRISLNGPTQRTFVDSGQFAAYLQRHTGCRYTGRQYTIGLFSYGHNRYDSSRQLVFGTINRRAEADYHGDEFAFYAEHGRIFRLGRFQFQPYGALQYINLHQSAFSETGADSMNLSVDAVGAQSFTGHLGTRLTCYKNLGPNLILAPEFRALWRHEFLDENRIVSAAFAAVPTGSYAVSGLDLGRDAAVLGGGVNLYLGRRTSLFANYDLLLNAVQVVHAGTGGLQVVW